MTSLIRVSLLAILMVCCCFSYGLMAQNTIQDAIAINMQNWQKLHNRHDSNHHFHYILFQ